MIEWKRTRKNGVVEIGTKRVGASTVTWTIKKSGGGLSYQLFLGEPTDTPMFTRATIDDCKIIAEVYL